MDYVLCYKYKKRRASKPRLSLTSNGSIPFPIPGRWDAEEAGEPAGDVVESKLSEEEKALMREEFEVGLLDAGLQIERDKEVCVCFLQCFLVDYFFISCALHLTLMGQMAFLGDVTTKPVIG